MCLGAEFPVLGVESLDARSRVSSEVYVGTN